MIASKQKNAINHAREFVFLHGWFERNFLAVCRNTIILRDIDGDSETRSECDAHKIVFSSPPSAQDFLITPKDFSYFYCCCSAKCVVCANPQNGCYTHPNPLIGGKLQRSDVRKWVSIVMASNLVCVDSHSTFHPPHKREAFGAV